MEILNNIWMAISTPNEMLINILVIPFGFIENLLIVSLFTSIFGTPLNKKSKLIYIISVPILSLLTLYLLPSPYNIFINYIIMISIFYMVFKVSFFKSIAHIIITGLVFNLIGSLILNPYITILNISIENLTTIPMYRIPYMSLMYLFVSIIILILKMKNIQIVFIDDIDRNTKIIIYSNIILGIITLIFQSIVAVYYIENLPISITILSFIPLLAYFLLSVYSLTRVFKLVLTSRKLQSAEEYNNTLRILHDNVRAFKHDFDNIVTTIGGYVRTDDMEGLKQYYLQLEDDCQRVNNLYILNPDVINNDGIYNLLTKKYYKAESKDIKVNISFLLDLSTLNMKIYEFARILGILLDNAIDAADECDEKIINITFRNDTNNSRQLVIIENTYKDKDVDTDKIFEKGVSGKENHTGLGLWEVRKLVKKNNNINLYTTKSDVYFKQQLEIYY